MQFSEEDLDFTKFKCSQLISRKVAIAIISRELREKYDDDRSATHRARLFLGYRIENGTLECENDLFISGRLAQVLRKKHPEKFVGWLRIEDEHTTEKIDLGVQHLPVEIPLDVIRKDEMIMSLSAALRLAEIERDRDSPEAEKWRQEQFQRSLNGKKGGRPSKGK
jgi:hypothetical protein